MAHNLLSSAQLLAQVPQMNWNLSPQKRNFIANQVNDYILLGGQNTMRHCLSYQEEEEFRSRLQNMQNGTILEGQTGGLSAAMSGKRIFWYKLDNEHIYQVETNTFVDLCYVTASV